MEKKLAELSKDNLKQILLNMTEFLSREQMLQLEEMIEQYMKENLEPERIRAAVRLPQALVDEKMEQFEALKRQIEEGELYLATEEYEDYSSGYWDCDWVTEYYDEQGIGDKIMAVIQFAKNCVDDRRYQEANYIYDWLWDMSVCCDSEYSDSIDLGHMADEKIVHTDIRQLALLTLYADYQVREVDERAECIYRYFEISSFQQLHIEEMFCIGLENLTGTEQFWKDWIRLLKAKGGDVEGRLLQEAILRHEGVKGLVKAADENSNMHPSLYLTAMAEYEKSHDYTQIEKIGERALEKIDSSLIIRSKAALKAAYASSCLMHRENMMLFCWEAFCSDSTDRNLLRLFGMEEMAKRYGIMAEKVLERKAKGKPAQGVRSNELRRNYMGDYEIYKIKFYSGDFETVKQASKNPKGSLGWSSGFIQYGIRLFLLYLYEDALPSDAAKAIASYVEFEKDANTDQMMDFEKEIAAESLGNGVSIFWSYFKRWKSYFPTEKSIREKYLAWAEKIVYSRADAIVSGQHRAHYGEVAALLAMAAQIKESMGMNMAKAEIFAMYKKKFPRHSSFQSEMRSYFGGKIG